jgi:hypothetical protein
MGDGPHSADLLEMAAFIINSSAGATLDVRSARRDDAPVQEYPVSTRRHRLLSYCFNVMNPVAITKIFIDG